MRRALKSVILIPTLVLIGAYMLYCEVKGGNILEGIKK